MASPDCDLCSISERVWRMGCLQSMSTLASVNSVFVTRVELWSEGSVFSRVGGCSLRLDTDLILLLLMIKIFLSY